VRRISLKVLSPFSGITIEIGPRRFGDAQDTFPLGFSFKSKKNFLFSTLSPCFQHLVHPDSYPDPEAL